jgi:hypothetical protein
VIVADDLSPPGWHSLELAADGAGAMTISPHRIRKAQFPDEITTESGYVLNRPDEWGDSSG